MNRYILLITATLSLNAYSDKALTSSDLEPPLVRGVSYVQASYRPGEMVIATFELTEPMVGAWTDRVEFVNLAAQSQDPNRSIPKKGLHKYKVKKMGKNQYGIRFQIPVWAEDANYIPYAFSRVDRYGNSASEIGQKDWLEKQIAKLSPVIVSKKAYPKVERDVNSMTFRVAESRAQFAKANPTDHDDIEWVKRFLEHMKTVDQLVRTYIKLPNQENTTPRKPPFSGSFFPRNGSKSTSSTLNC